MKYILVFALIFIFNSVYSQASALPKKSTAASTKQSVKPKFKYDMSYSKDAFILDQLTNGDSMGCWAYAATSMYEWKKQASYAVDEVMKLATYRSKKKIKYTKYFSNNLGLPFKYTTDFANAIDLIPLNYSPNASILYDLLASKGPLLFFHNSTPTDANATGHLLVIIGLKTNNFDDSNFTWLEYLDPWHGKHSYMSFAEYAQKYTSLKGPDNYIFHNK